MERRAGLCQMLYVACIIIGIALGIWLSSWFPKLPGGDDGKNPWC